MKGYKCVPALGGAVLAIAALDGLAREPGQKTVTAEDCVFETAPDEFLSRQARLREEIYRRAGKVRPGATRRAEDAAEPPRRNLVDDAIFGTLAERGVPSAPLASDEEFYRRIHLDLTGRLPSADSVRAFLDDASSTKRDDAIESLLASEEFNDRWTLWFGDLLQNTATSQNVQRQIRGRNAFHAWIRASVAANKSLSDLAREAVSLAGNNFAADRGGANFAVGAVTPMGPIQDTYDAMLAKTAGTFLGMGQYDCLLCHSGRGHLEQVSLWGSAATRSQAQRMAAFFSRMRLTRNRTAPDDPQYLSYEVTDAERGGYNLNTNFGNRPARQPFGSEQSLTPEYHFTGAVPEGGNWRASFADSMVKDRMFSRNFANRLWKHFFGLGLVDPVDSLDPARLDPANPPPEPWTLQATHPALLEALAVELESSGFNLRGLIRLLAQSSAYQLSSRYPGEWKLEYVPLFARHYPRRLEGEEIHDAIAKAAGIPGNYAIQEWPDPVAWAVALPEPAEPRRGGGAAAFMNSFLRGNRDTQQRSQAGSILQQLSLMNDNFVLSRLRVSESPTLLEISGLSDDEAVERLFLTFLSRRPAEGERSRALSALAGVSGDARNRALEDLAWVAVNKLEFIFSY